MINFLRAALGQRIINIYHLFQAILANLVYRFPSRRLKVIGVTGTDGKTTTVNLIASILEAGGHKVSFLSTINAKIGQKNYDTGLHTTTPSSFLLQKLLKQMVKAESEFAVLEVTSHALDQYRTWGIQFETAVLTNITPEHLDYHKTLEEYAKAKIKLFENAKCGILNIVNVRQIREGNKKIITYGLSAEAQIWADNIREDLQTTDFQARILNSTINIHLSLPGRFNVLNALAAICVGQVYQMPFEAIQAGLEQVQSVPGRMEYLQARQEFLAMVDFAHTPNALENLLSFLRPKISGKIILVFGSAGERDRFKRPQMGKVADELADVVVITREDNRQEKAEDICQEIVSGMRQKVHDRELFVILDRRRAIAFALQKATKNDIVVVTGKGHEQSLNVDGKEIPWDDRKVVREEIKQMIKQ